MNAKHRRTLEAVFAQPPPATMEWKQIESLFRALGAEIQEHEGSRIRVALNTARAGFHRPNPRKDVGRLTVRDVRDFLSHAGVKP